MTQGRDHGRAAVRPQPDRSDRPPADLKDFATAEEADHWLRVNSGNWLGALRSASGGARHVEVLDCAESMHWFSDRWIHWPHWGEVFTLGAEAATALGDTAQHATQLNYLAWVHLVPPEDPEATMRYATQALDLATRSGATAQIAWAHQYTAEALRRLGRLDEAFDSLAKAAEMFNAAADIDAYCQSLSTLGDGRHEAALEQYLEVRALLDDEGSGMTADIVSFTRPHTLARIGHCLRLLGHRAEAITTLTEAIALMEQFQTISSQARALETLAAVLAEEGRTEESRRAYARAAELFEASGDAEAGGRCHDLATAAR
ncbi:tetratricopeptide repeat protein [Streptosporangium sp. NPDC006013]|uniref:tetratricopeptide repeat protein n=1 Tax=Streptosporangium sp. NPDC006013 TaxID=3155596 RepID=UPI0033A36EEB